MHIPSCTIYYFEKRKMPTNMSCTVHCTFVLLAPVQLNITKPSNQATKPPTSKAVNQTDKTKLRNYV